MTTPSAPARLTGPGQLAAALPALLGFVPTESLVALSLHGPRQRLGLVARVDLPPAGHVERVVDDVLRALAGDGADLALVVLVTQAPGQRPHAAVAEAVRTGVARHDLRLGELMLLRADRWRSYLCSNTGCCPPAGRPLPTTSDQVQRLHAELAWRGRAVLPDRQALTDSFAGPVGLAAEQARRRVRRAEQALQRDQRSRGRCAVRQDLRRAWRAAVARAEDPRAAVPDPERLVLGLREGSVRDVVTYAALDDAPGLQSLLQSLARATPAPYDGGLCAVLAGWAYLQGEGALAGLALDRALASEPQQPLALLLSQALEALVPPQQLRAALRGQPVTQKPATSCGE